MFNLLHHRYKILRLLGIVSHTALFIAYDSLKDREVFWTFVFFPNIEQDNWTQIFSYYEHLQEWSQNTKTKFICPIEDFAEIKLSSNRSFLDEVFPKIEFSEKARGCYFVSSCSMQWQLLKKDSFDEPSKFLPVLHSSLKGLAWLHRRGFSYYNLSPFSILYDSRSSEIAFLNVGMIPPGHLHFPHSPFAPEDVELDCRFDIYALAATFCYYWTGEFPCQSLKKFALSPEMISFLERSLEKFPEKRFGDVSEIAREAIFSDQLSLATRNFSLQNSFWENNLWKKLRKTIENPTQKNIAYFLEGKPGQGKTIYLQQAQRLSEQKKYRIINLSFHPQSNFLLSPLWEMLENLASEKVETATRLYKTLSFLERYSHTQRVISQSILEDTSQPTILLIDNMQWASEEFLTILETILKLYARDAKSKSYEKLLIIAFSLPDRAIKKFYQRISENPLTKEIVQCEQVSEVSFCEKLIASKLGVQKAPKLFSRKLSQISAGNPLYIQMTLTSLLKKGTLYLEDGEWYMDCDTIDHLDLPSNLEHAVEKYISSFSPVAQKGISLLSHTGSYLQFDFLRHFENSKTEVFSALWELYQSSILNIQKNFKIGISQGTIWHYLWTKNRDNGKAFSINESQRKTPYEKFLFAFLYLNREWSKLQPHFSYVVESLLQLGFQKLLIRWLEKYLYRHDTKSKNSKQILYIADLAFITGKYDIASFWFQDLGDESVHTLLKTTESLLREKKPAQAVPLINTIKNLLKEENSYERAYYCRLKGSVKYLQGEIKSACNYFQKALGILTSLFFESNNQHEKRQNLALYYETLTEEFFLEHSLQLRRCLETCREMLYHCDIPLMNMHIFYLFARLDKNLGNYAGALEALQKSLDLSKKILSPFTSILCRKEIADIYTNLGCYEKAEEHLKEAFELCDIYNIESCLGKLYISQGRLEFAQKQIQKSHDQYINAINILQKQEQNMGLSLAYIHLSEAYVGKDEEKSLFYHQKSSEILEKIPYPRLILQVNLVKMKIAHYYNRRENLLEIVDKMLIIAKEYGYREYLWGFFYQKACAFRALGDIVQSSENYHLAWEVIEEIAEKLPVEIRKAYLATSYPKNISETLSLLTTDIKGEINTLSKEEDLLEKIVSESQKEVILESFNELKDETVNLRKLLEINKRLNCEHDLNRLLDFIMDSAIEITNAERGFLILTSTRQEKMFEVARNFEHEDIRNPEFEISHSITEKVIRTGLAILAKDALHDERFDGYRSVSELQLHSVMAVPLRVKERILGAVYLDNRFEKAIFSEKEKILVEAFADQAAIAIENTRLFQENHKKQEELEKSKKHIEKLNKELAVLNSKLAKRLEKQKEELVDVKNILIRTQSENHTRYKYSNIIGKSPIMQKQVFNILDKIVDKNIPVLIYGESGTGKELVAKAIHFNSLRRDNNFLSENCAAITESLLESELFGHVKGAFTGAYADKKGLFELADGGTLFLDEVGDMSVGMQASLLRVLENNVIRRVGGKKEIPVDTRIISASNKDLKELTKQGEFREDLFFRLKVVQINLPALRQRKEDIPLLVAHFIEQYANENSCEIRNVSKKGLQFLMNYDWPGNIRELRNAIYTTLSLHDEKELSPTHFQESISDHSSQQEDIFSQELSIDEYAKRFVMVNQEKYNDSQLSKILGFSRKTLWEKRKKWMLFRS